MIFVRIILTFMLIVLFQSCQVIEFPEDIKNSDTPVDNNTGPKFISEKTENYNTSIDENGHSTGGLATTDFTPPQNGFNKGISLNLQKEYPFTNFETRDFKNPFYSAATFLYSIDNRNYAKLLTATDNNIMLFRNIKPEDSAQFWRYVCGIVGLYLGISDMREVEGNLHFTLKSISKFASTVLVLSTDSETWKISNVLKVMRIKSTRVNGIRKYDEGNYIWQGNWEVGKIDKYEFMLTKPKLEKINLLGKILSEAQEGINNIASSFITTEMRKKALPKFMLNSRSNFDSKFRENIFTLNFYKTYALLDLINIYMFPVTENLQIETFIAIFNTKINSIVFVNWLVIGGVPYIERIELPTGSSLQVYFREAD
ncbi:MAG: hypothetical protein K8S87_11980 [Planctomycetes bacterium]|nr:hypothetical protein [Planctomycetota bacterium]